MNFCKECGFQISVNFRFCPQCGAKNSSEPEEGLDNGKVVPLSANNTGFDNQSSVDFFGDEIDVSGLASTLNETKDSFDWSGYIKCDDGIMYKGEMVGGLRHGRGQSFYAYFPGKVQDDGTWNMGLLHGFVKCYNPFGGLTFEGHYENGKRNGFGILYNDGVKIYEGEFLNDKVTGTGKVYYSDGTICYEGELVDYTPHGKGAYYHSEEHGEGLVLFGDFKEGDICIGNWDDGEFIY